MVRRQNVWSREPRAPASRRHWILRSSFPTTKALERDLTEAKGNIEETNASIAESKAKIAEIQLALINVSSEMREEAIKARRVTHENVVRALDRGETDKGESYIVYELIGHPRPRRDRRRRCAAAPASPTARR